VHKVPDLSKDVMGNMEVAMNYLYRALETENKIRSYPVNISFKDSFDGMYLGSSAGLNPGKDEEILSDNIYIKKVHSGKKIEHREADLKAVLQAIATGVYPQVVWNKTGKHELYFSFDKQLDDESYSKWKQKMRIFEIPSSFLIYVERLVSVFPRHMIERGKMIRIGQKWSRGGVIDLMEALGVTEETMDVPDIVESDVTKLDQSVYCIFLDLYFSSMLVYDKKDPIFYEIKKRLVAWLSKHFITRIVHLFGHVWGQVRGGVPSGAFNTSHMDSWILSLWFFLFCAYQIQNAPHHERPFLEELLRLIIRFVVYGDDNLWKKGSTIYSHYFSGTNFSIFMKKFFNVDLRDVRDGIPFRSTCRNGYLVRRGACFLKYYFVDNPLKGQGKACLIPFRETRDLIIRAIWGREVRERDAYDVILSVLGHAYGTYGSNKEAHSILHLMYQECVKYLGCTSESFKACMQSRMREHNLRELRKRGMDPADVFKAFPTWDSLQQKNVYDPQYHRRREVEPDISDFFFDNE